MARKSSKTAHVMNLLAGGEAESSKSEAAKENLAASQAAESKGTIKELTVLAQQASIQMQDSPLSPSPISIIDLSSSVQDPVAELIKQQLEEDEKKELGKGFSEINEDESLPDSLSDPVSDNIINNEEDLTSADSEEVPVTEQVTELYDNSADETDGQDLDDQNEPSISDVNEQVQMDTLSIDEPDLTGIEESDESEQTDIGAADPPVTPKTSNFKYLNVMEHVVENIARDYIGRLGGCTCEHCIADVTALTLNKLSPKYVVVEPPAASPLLNFYSSRFAPQVIVELTKSCFIVKENPHH